MKSVRRVKVTGSRGRNRNADTEIKARRALKGKCGLQFRKTGVHIGCVVEKKMSGKGQPPEPPLWRAAVFPPHRLHLVTFSDAIYHTQPVMDTSTAHTWLLCASTSMHLNTYYTGQEQLHTVIDAHTNRREREQMSEGAGEKKRERERETINSLGTYTDAVPILQQRVEPRVDRKGRGGFAAMTS